MKHKYSVLTDDEKKELIIREYAEIDKETLSLVYESTYPGSQIKSATSKGTEALISVLRTPNFYPAGVYAQKIAEAVQNFYHLNTTEPVDLLFDDIDLIPKGARQPIAAEDIDDDDDEVDDLIEDDFDEKYNDKPAIKNLNASIKIDDDEFEDVDDND